MVMVLTELGLEYPHRIMNDEAAETQIIDVRFAFPGVGTSAFTFV